MIKTLNDLRPVTLWSRETGEKGKYAYNHLEDGWDQSALQPTIKHPDQQSWKNSKWIKELAYLYVKDKPGVVVHAGSEDKIEIT